MSIKNPYKEPVCVCKNCPDERLECGKTCMKDSEISGEEAGKYYAFNEGVKATLEYMEEPCYEHCPGRHRINTLYKDHRKDCDFCMAEVHEELGQ